MDLTSTVFCPNCGAAIDASDHATANLSCGGCGRRVVLRRWSTRTEVVAIDDGEAERDATLALLDQAWEQERQKHLVLEHGAGLELGPFNFRSVTWREPSNRRAFLFFGIGIASATLLLLGIGTPAYGLRPAVGAAVAMVTCALLAIREMYLASALAGAEHRYAESSAKLEQGEPLDSDDWSGDAPWALPDARSLPDDAPGDVSPPPTPAARS